MTVDNRGIQACVGGSDTVNCPHASLSETSPMVVRALGLGLVFFALSQRQVMIRMCKPELNYLR